MTQEMLTQEMLDEFKKHPTKLTFGGIPAVYITVADEVYIAVKKADVDAITMRVMTSMVR